MTQLETIIKDSEASRALEKALHGERLDFNDGVELMKSDDLNLVGSVADRVRRQLVGDRVSFVVSYNLNYSNLCVARCSICAFYRPYKKGAMPDEGYTLSVEEAVRQVGDAVSMGATEIHIVGGFNPELPLEYYEGLIAGIKSRWSTVTVKALTLAEIVFISRITRNSVKEVFTRLKAAGLDASTGGGAEIFDPTVRDQISTPPKCSGEDWLRTAEEGHHLGVPGNSTMLYGHVEKPEHRVHHILKLREVQERAPGFLSFIPLKFSPEGTELFLQGKVSGPAPSPDDLKVIAVSRLLLANSINNISVYWVALGLDVAQVGLSYGGNDLVGTAFSEKIYRATGRAETVSLESLTNTIREIGRVPVQRDTFYNALRNW
jgi:aminodeoxyfutalosine synthase